MQDTNAGPRTALKQKDFLRRESNIGDEKTSAKKHYYNSIFSSIVLVKNDLTIELTKSNMF